MGYIRIEHLAGGAASLAVLWRADTRAAYDANMTDARGRTTAQRRIERGVMGDGLRVMVMAEDGAGRGGWGCSAGAAVNRLHRKPYQPKEESRERRDERQEKNKEESR